MRIVIGAIAVTALSGCASTFETHAIDPKSGEPNHITNGLVYYEPRPFIVTYEFRQRTDKDGNLLGSAAQHTCEPLVQRTEIQFLPDYAHPRLITYSPSAFSTGKFSISLNNGVITALGTENGASAPTTFGALVKPYDFGAKTSSLRAPTRPACNAGPTIASITPAEFGK